MELLSSEKRTVKTAKGVIEYTFERKEVKNINLRIRHDGNVYVSASVKTPVETVENFIISKTDYIFRALSNFSHMEFSKTSLGMYIILYSFRICKLSFSISILFHNSIHL